MPDPRLITGGPVTVWHGDCVDVLAAMADASVDAVVTDPPYGLEFMGKEWDRPWAVGMSSPGYTDGKRLERPSFGDGRNANCRTCGGRQRGARRCVCPDPAWDRHPREDMLAFGAWCHEWAIECLRVLKPGGHLLAFGGTRTWHRLACAIEDAGFEVRDSIAWLYGSGFPKSLDVSKAIDKAAGATREVIGKTARCIGPSQGRGSLGGEAFRETTWEQSNDATAPATDEARTWAGWGTALKPAHEPIVVARKPIRGTVAANVLAHGTGALNIDGCRVATTDDLNGGAYSTGGRTADLPGADRTTAAAGMMAEGGGRLPGQYSQPDGRWPPNVLLDGDSADQLDKQSGTLTSGANPTRRGSDKFRDAYGEFAGQTECEPARGVDTGGASRFFPTFRYEAKAPAAERPFYWRHVCACPYDHPATPNGSCNVCGVPFKREAHPTVKPIELMRWLIRLVTPPGGTVLDLFAGSGTTGEAASLERVKCVLIERDADYLPLIAQRQAKRGDPVAYLKSRGDDGGLFDLIGGDDA